jgi:hypothetical protein
MTDKKHLTDKEFIIELRQKWPRSSIESEALDRLEHLLDMVEDLEAECAEWQQKLKLHMKGFK